MAKDKPPGLVFPLGESDDPSERGVHRRAVWIVVVLRGIG